MKKRTLTLTLILITNLSLFSQNTKRGKEEQDFVVTLNNDTIYGSIGTWGVSRTAWGGYSYGIKTKDGNRTRYNVDEAKIVFFDGNVYEAKPKKPKKGSDSKKDFMQVFMRNANCTMYCYSISGLNSSSIDFYLFENDKFIDEVKKSNHKELILKYFGDCEGIAKAFKTKDNWFGKLGQLSVIYSNYKCK